MDSGVCFFHGAVLFALLLGVISIIGGVSTWVFPGIASTVIAFVIAAFVEGIVAQRVTRW